MVGGDFLLFVGGIEVGQGFWFGFDVDVVVFVWLQYYFLEVDQVDWGDVVFGQGEIQLCYVCVGYFVGVVYVYGGYQLLVFYGYCQVVVVELCVGQVVVECELWYQIFGGELFVVYVGVFDVVVDGVVGFLFGCEVQFVYVWMW